MEPYRFRRGQAPLLVSMPHAGTFVPDDLAARMTPAARALPDTDWHVDRLYDFLDQIGASVIQATHSRYVIDLNRPPDGDNLYPGQDTPALVPIDTFAKEPVWLPGQEPSTDEVLARRERWWKPYHARLAEEIEALRARHGVACLWEAHSIRSVVPRFAAARLPDLSLGTGGGRTCAPERAARLLAIARESPYSAVLDGRFQGGYITRHYGDPGRGVHAVQLELAQCCYMQEDAGQTFRDDLAARLRPWLRRMVEGFVVTP